MQIRVSSLHQRSFNEIEFGQSERAFERSVFCSLFLGEQVLEISGNSFIEKVGNPRSRGVSGKFTPAVGINSVTSISSRESKR